MKRWLLRIYDVNDKVLHDERFWLRRNAQHTADQLVRPLPPIQAMADALRECGPLLRYEITKAAR